jgi:hypothetical protein
MPRRKPHFKTNHHPEKQQRRDCDRPRLIVRHETNREIKVESGRGATWRSHATQSCYIGRKLPNSSGTPRHDEKSSATLPGRVEKVIKPIHPSQPEKAQISVDGADHLYREIRLENKLTDEKGNEVKLRPGQPWM